MTMRSGSPVCVAPTRTRQHSAARSESVKAQNISVHVTDVSFKPESRQSLGSGVFLGLAIGAAAVLPIPALIFFLAVQRYLIAGWGASGVKG